MTRSRTRGPRAAALFLVPAALLLAGCGPKEEAAESGNTQANQAAAAQAGATAGNNGAQQAKPPFDPSK